MTEDDERPPIWAGHISVTTRELATAAAFYRDIGMREIGVYDEVAIFELRGGTHLVVLKAEDADGGHTAWDLMVEDVAATHQEWSAKGLTVSPIEKGSIHDSFTVTDPDGNTIQVNSSHVMGVV